MFRLFLITFSAAVLGLAAVVFGLQIVTDKLVSRQLSVFYENTFTGIFRLLDDSVANHRQGDVDVIVQRLQATFKHPLVYCPASILYHEASASRRSMQA